jgi:HSP20-like domain of unknown function (DUF1813).
MRFILHTSIINCIFVARNYSHVTKKKSFPQSGERRLKVYPKYFQRSYRGVIFPEIRLCGKWLQESGFASGQEVIVLHTQNKIIITTQNPSDDPEGGQ